MSDVIEIKEDIKDIKKILIGNGKIGVAEQARRAFEYCQWHKTTKNGRLDWTYRIVISIILVFIATQVGLK